MRLDGDKWVIVYDYEGRRREALTEPGLGLTVMVQHPGGFDALRLAWTGTRDAQGRRVYA